MARKKLLENFLVPKYRLIKKDSEEYKKIVEMHGDPDKYPKILLNDPVSKDLKAEIGDIIEFKRNVDGLEYTYYRVVVLR